MTKTQVAPEPKNGGDVARLLAEAMRHEKAGEVDAAELRYRAVLGRAPRNLTANHQLGLILYAKGRIDDALDHLRAAAAADPTSASIRRNIGLILVHAGRPADAIPAFDAALAVDPRDVGSLISQGVALKRLNRLEEAVARYDRALALSPENKEALGNKGIALRALKRYAEARACYDRLIALDPNNPDGLVNRANLLVDMRETGAALADYDRALALRPGHADALVGRGTALYTMRRLEDALACYDRAASIKNSAPAHSGRGAVLFEMRRHDEALRSFDQALALDGNDLAALNGKASNLFSLARHEEALETYHRALGVRADDPDALNGIGNALFNLRRFDEALAAYDRAISADIGLSGPAGAPNNTAAQARNNRGLLLLAMGDFERGWQDYETRRIVVGVPVQSRDCRAPYWRGENLRGKRIVVLEEQGLGDTLQFCRYLPMLEERGAIVTFQIRKSMHRLLRSLSPTLRLVENLQPGETYDFKSLLMSLPGSFCTRADTIPAPVGYLKAEAPLVETWRDRLGRDRNVFRVGICWQGNPDGAVDVGRSIPLASFGPVAAVPTVELVSLQKNYGLDQIGGCGFPLRCLGDGFDAGPDAFIDTAAVMANLDLVITSDTSVAHLAGALGVPTWVILKTVPDWRWRLEGTHSAWYPTAKLYRQCSPDAWDKPIKAAARDLAQMLGVQLPAAGRRRVDTLAAPAAVGEILEKITILEIKSERIRDAVKLANVRFELDLLSDLVASHVAPCQDHTRLMSELKSVNEALWVIEDDIRECESRSDFGPTFIELARAVYKTNDRRAVLKRKLNELHGSAILEEKSYAGMGSG